MSNLKDWNDLSDDEETESREINRVQSTGHTHRDNTHDKTNENSGNREEAADSYVRKPQPRKPDYGGRSLPSIPKDGPTPFLVLVSNLNFEATIEDVGSFFAEGGCDVNDVILPTDGRGRAFVYMENKESQENSKNAQGFEFMGRPINVRIYNEYRSQSQSDMPGRRVPGRSGNTGRGDRYSAAPADRQMPVRREIVKDENVWDRGRPSGHLKPTQAPVEAPKETIVSVKPAEQLEPPKERPPLNLKPRTAPIEEIGKKVVAPASIFGEGKPRDVFTHEV
jgi:hypothetical protein